MTEEQERNLDLYRLNRLQNSIKNIKSPGVTKKLLRKIRKGVNNGIEKTFG